MNFWQACLKNQISPGEWGIYGSDFEGRSDESGFVLSSWVFDEFIRDEFNGRREEFRFSSKRTFAEWCEEHGLAHPMTFGVWGETSETEEEQVLEAIEGGRRKREFDNLALKPLEASHGDGLKFLSLPTEEGEVARRLLRRRLNEEVTRTGGESAVLVQERLSQHADYAAPHPHSINTIRVVTFRKNTGEVEIDGAVWRMGRKGSIVDSWRRGGLAAGVDIETGEVGSAHQLVESGVEWFEEHPDTGSAIVGRSLPGWSDVLEAARRGAEAVEGPRWLGWDVVMSTDGPVLLEVNHGWALPIMLVHRGGKVPRDWAERLREIDREELLEDRIRPLRFLWYLSTALRERLLREL